MSHQSHTNFMQSANKRQGADFPSQPSALAFLPQLPADILNYICCYLPWHERVLRLSHVHRRLPCAWLVWTEHDHVRLSEALLIAISMRRPSALQCARSVQSCCVERVGQNQQANCIEGDHDAERDPDEPYDAQQQPQPATPLETLVQSMQLSAIMQPGDTAAPFGNLRSLVAPYTIFQRLLDWSRLPHLKAVDFHRSNTLDDDGRSVSDERHSQVVAEYLRSVPPLRRLRAEGVHVSLADLYALPVLEEADVGECGCEVRHIEAAHTKPPAVPTSPFLRRLCLASSGVIGYYLHAEDIRAALLPQSLQHLSLTARLTNDDLDAIATLSSLESLELQSCYFDDTNALSRFTSRESQPLLPRLQQFSIGDSDAHAIDYDGMRSSTAAFLLAFKEQLRRVRLSVKTDPANSLAAVLSVILFGMPHLCSIELEVEHSMYDEASVVHAIESLSGSSAQQPATPSLSQLRSLTLCGLPLSNTAVDQLLTCCPGLLEVTLNGLALLTADFWPSMLRCRQLLSFCFHGALEVAPKAAVFPLSVSSTSHCSSSLSRPTSPNFPALRHAGLSFVSYSRDVQYDVSHLLDMFHGSPMTSLALRLPYNEVGHAALFSRLGSLSRLHALLLVLGVDVVEVEDVEDMQESLSGADVVRLVDRCSAPLRWSSEQHGVFMRYHWRESALGEDEGELRAKYAAGIKAPFQVDDELLVWSNDSSSRSGYRVFKQPAAEAHLDGWPALFQSLERNCGQQA